MKGFTMILHDATQSQRFSGVTAFVGEDNSGSFGIYPHHQRIITPLVFGLARFRQQTAPWHYLALPSALLYFVDNRLTITTRRYLVDDDYRSLSHALQQQLLAEEVALQGLKQNLQQIDEMMLRRLWSIERSGI